MTTGTITADATTAPSAAGSTYHLTGTAAGTLYPAIHAAVGSGIDATDVLATLLQGSVTDQWQQQHRGFLSFDLSELATLSRYQKITAANVTMKLTQKSIGTYQPWPDDTYMGVVLAMQREQYMSTQNLNASSYSSVVFGNASMDIASNYLLYSSLSVGSVHTFYLNSAAITYLNQAWTKTLDADGVYDEKVFFTMAFGGDAKIQQPTWGGYDGTGAVIRFDGPSATTKPKLNLTFSDGLQINIGDTWKNVKDIYINIGDSWKKVDDIYINRSDIWKGVVDDIPASP